MNPLFAEILKPYAPPSDAQIERDMLEQERDMLRARVDYLEAQLQLIRAVVNAGLT